MMRMKVEPFLEQSIHQNFYTYLSYESDYFSDECQSNPEVTTDFSNLLLPECLDAVGNLLNDFCSEDDQQSAARILRGVYAVLEGIPFGGLDNKASTENFHRLITTLLKVRLQTESHDLANLASSCALALANATGSCDELLEVAANFLCQSDEVSCRDDLCPIPRQFLCDYNRIRNIASDADPLQLLLTVSNIDLEATIDAAVLNLRFCSDGHFLFLICSSGLFKIGTGFGETVTGRLYGTNDMFKVSQDALTI